MSPASVEAIYAVEIFRDLTIAAILLFLIFFHFEAFSCPRSKGFHDFCLCLLLKLGLVS